MPPAGKSRSVRVEMLARVEGEGGLHVRIRNGKVAAVKLDIFEPPRLFEAFLRGRQHSDAPDFTARICGICPVAYQMSAVQAIERAFGVEVAALGEGAAAAALLRRVDREPRAARVHAPRPGLPRLRERAGHGKDHPDAVNRGLQLKKIGNALMARIGGREIHPINVRVGGFWRMPRREELLPLVDQLEWGRAAALQTVQWVAGFDFPDFTRDVEFVALRHPDEYPLCEGRVVSSAGIDIDVDEYERVFAEEHVERSNALHSHVIGRGNYSTGPVARWNLNADRLSPLALDAAREAGLERPCRNPFRSIVVRAVELLWAFDEALRLVAEYEPPDEAPWVEPVPRAGARRGRERGPARDPVPPLRSRRRRDDPRRAHRAADRAEPRHDGGRPRRLRRGATCRSTTGRSPGSASRPSATTTRASRAPRTS